MYKFSIIPDFSGSSAVLPIVHGGGSDSAGGVWAVIIDLMDKITRFVESGTSFELFPGITALANNIHPLIVHFPIAFLTAFFLIEVVGVLLRQESLRQTASWLLYLGTLGALGAVVTGLIAEDTVPHGEAVHEIMEWHGRLGITAATLSAALAVWRIATRANFSAMAKALHLYLAAMVAICIFFGADLGGLMVYQHGVGVKTLQQADEHHHHQHATPPHPGDAQLPDR